MIIVTGAAGFIGSATVAKLNDEKCYDIIAVDLWDIKNTPYLDNKKIREKIHPLELPHFINKNWKQIQFIIHLGAITDTTTFDEIPFNTWNLEYSLILWSLSAKYQIPFIYASSAATYGNGNNGFQDDTQTLPNLQPMNPYAAAKHLFDIITNVNDPQYSLSIIRKYSHKYPILTKTAEKYINLPKPYFYVGLKFFNVYGPNEYHKGRMASVIFHAFNQIKSIGKIKLFQSHKKEIPHGEQKRDFVYVKDVVNVITFFMKNRTKELSGIYNVGTGNPASFNTLAKAIFYALNKEISIEYIPTPEDIRDKYQYYTVAPIAKLQQAGYSHPFLTIEEGIKDYICNYLVNNRYW